MKQSDRVWLMDVAARDGFQIEPQPVSIETKIETINALGEAGLPGIEATAFVHPKVVPQMADAEEVMARIVRYPHTRYSALVANLRGAERAVLTGVDQLNLVVSASESHNKANIRRGTFETLAESKDIVKLADKHGITAVGGIATSIGRYDGNGQSCTG
jgi:hydroxymethylglutaryl-CoA lyase